MKLRTWLLLFAAGAAVLCVAGGIVLAVSALSRDLLRADVAEVLAVDGSPAPALTCAMFEASRAGSCQFVAAPEHIAAVVQQLALQAVAAEAYAELPPLAQTPSGCLADTHPAPAVYWVGGAPPQLDLQNGGQLIYLLLVYHPDTGRACVQVEYAYG